MDGWIKIQKKLRLFQDSPCCIWKTYEPVFCNLTKKQIWQGYIIATDDGIIGIYGHKVIKRVLMELLVDYEYIHTRGVESMALPLKRTIKAERGKMNMTIRYKILQRDKFRCAACGARAGDVDLHIDHVVPVSKGGLTIESNLQSLCDKCNIGKSNKL